MYIHVHIHDLPNSSTDGLLTMDPIVTVEEGQNVMVCINLICTGSVLGCPLTVNLETTDSAKAGSNITLFS